MKIFDYLFYRLYSFYSTKDKKGSPLFTSVLYLSFVQIIFIYIVIAMYFITTKDYFNILSWLRQNKGLSKGVFVLILLLLEVFNYLRYGNRQNRDKLISRYKSNRLNRSLKVWMLVPFVAFLIFLPFIFSRLMNLF
jgi:uncharacterized membrane protein